MPKIGARHLIAIALATPELLFDKTWQPGEIELVARYRRMHTV